MEQVSISAVVVDRKLDVQDQMRRYLAESVRHWPDGPVTVTVKRERPDKTTLQMGYYRGLVLPMIVEETENDLDQVHMRLKAMHLDPVRVEWTDPTSGEVIEKDLVPSLGDLNTKQMNTFLDKVIQWAGEFLGLEVPPPDPAWRAKKTA